MKLRIGAGTKTFSVTQSMQPDLALIEGEEAKPLGLDQRLDIVDPTDGPTAIQDAINSMAPTGGVVMLRPGTFTYSTEIKGKKLVSLQGSGRGVTILNYTGSGRGLSLTSNGAEMWYSSLADFTLTTPVTVPPYGGTYGLVLDDVNQTSTLRVEVTRWGVSGLLLKGAFACLSHTFDQVDIHKNNNGVRTAGRNAVINHINFVNSRIRASQQWNLYNDLDVRSWTILGGNMEAGILGALYMNEFLGLVVNTYFEQTSAVPAVVLGDTSIGAGLAMFGCGIQGTGMTNGATAVKLGAGGGRVFGSVVNNSFQAWQVGINKAGLQPGGDYTTGNRYSSVTTPTR